MELVLRSLADRDISRGAFPSAAVDLAVMFLLRETKYVDAMEVSIILLLLPLLALYWYTYTIVYAVLLINTNIISCLCLLSI